MKTFLKWLETIDEDKLRTSLGIYPPAYGSGNYPPLYFAPISATHVSSILNNHADEHPELINPKLKKKKKRTKKHKK